MFTRRNSSSDQPKAIEKLCSYEIGKPRLYAKPQATAHDRRQTLFAYQNNITSVRYRDFVASATIAKLYVGLYQLDLH